MLLLALLSVNFGVNRPIVSLPFVGKRRYFLCMYRVLSHPIRHFSPLIPSQDLKPPSDAAKCSANLLNSLCRRAALDKSAGFRQSTAFNSWYTESKRRSAKLKFKAPLHILYSTVQQPQACFPLSSRYGYWVSGSPARSVLSHPVSGCSLWGLNCFPPPCSNPVCVLSRPGWANWIQPSVSATRAHPGVNLDHDGNYWPGVQPVGRYEGVKQFHWGRSQTASSAHWPWRKLWGRGRNRDGGKVDPSISTLTPQW